jgi:hypothetical protein
LFHLCLRENNTPNAWASPHRGTQHSIYVLERNHTPNSWASLHRVTQHSISVSERNHTPSSWASSLHTWALHHSTQGHNVPSSSQRGTTHPSHGHTEIMGFLTPHRGTQRSFSISERNHTPNSWAHLTHGLSLRPTHSACVLENVSRNCNHQHSLSTREAFSIRPSFAWKYLNFFLVVVINTPS